MAEDIKREQEINEQTSESQEQTKEVKPEKKEKTIRFIKNKNR